MENALVWGPESPGAHGADRISSVQERNASYPSLVAAAAQSSSPQQHIVKSARGVIVLHRNLLARMISRVWKFLRPCERSSFFCSSALVGNVTAPDVRDIVRLKDSKSRCRVEGCQVVLAEESVRSLRVKICQEHQRAESVIICAEQHRFCQQCMRTQQISAFDGAKRTCRARLARHGARRNHLASYIIVCTELVVNVRTIYVVQHRLACWLGGEEKDMRSELQSKRKIFSSR
eukprot:scaffold499309_cov43-Prasinocladus_malaysianus.AAC.1